MKGVRLGVPLDAGLKTRVWGHVVHWEAILGNAGGGSGREMGKMGVPVESKVMSQFPLWATGARSYWETLQASGERAAEVSHLRGGVRGHLSLGGGGSGCS